MRSEHKRLDRLIERKGLCPVHVVKLTCGCTRKWTWTGSREEWQEYSGMLQRVDHLYTPLFVHGDCPTCRGERYCETCAKGHLARGPNPFTEPEMERMLTLAALLVRQEPDHAV